MQYPDSTLYDTLNIFRINLERRRGNVDAVHELYSACIAKGKNKATKTALSIK